MSPDTLNDQPSLYDSGMAVSDPLAATFEHVGRVFKHKHDILPRTDVADTVRAFAGEYMRPCVYDAAKMCDVLDMLNHSETERNVLRSLKTYQQSIGAEGIAAYEYITDTAGDIEAINNYVSSLLDYNGALPGATSEKMSALNNPNHHITNELWLGGPLQPDLESLDELADKVHLETIVVKAAQALNKLDDSDMSETETLRIIAAIETVYIPLCEQIGLDAFAATLNDRVVRTRFSKGGRADLIEKAEATLAEIGTRDEVGEFIQSVPGILFDEVETDPVVRDGNGDEAYFCYTLAMRDANEIKIVSRLKTVGSLARKFQYQESQTENHAGTPSDVVGYTVICNDPVEVATIYAESVKKLQLSPGYMPNNSPSRKEYLHAKGTPDFISLVENQLEEYSVSDPLDLKPNEGGFEVAKITLLLPVQGKDGGSLVPVEIQFLDRDSRMESRTGFDSHILFKLRKYGENSVANTEFLKSERAIACQKRIHRRRGYMKKKHDFDNKKSNQRGAKLREQIEATMFPYNAGRAVTRHL